MCGLVIDPTQLNVSTSQSPLVLTTRPSGPLNDWQMPAPYRIADVIETNATYYMDFFWRQDVRPGNC